MRTNTPTIDRIAPTRRPHKKASGYQRWTDLLFVHWRVPPAMIAPLLPPRLSVDTWDGDAWVGLVPFYMSGVRPWWSAAVPGISNFCETNLRTYVHLDGQNPGVWFFSLEASNSLAVRIARRFWNLPYFKANMSLARQGEHIIYEIARLWPHPVGAMTRIEARIGDALNSAGGEPGRAVEGTLEFFLAERYLLYSADGAGRLYRGQVHHRPYPLRHAEVLGLEETLLPSAGIQPPDDFCHALFSDGVEVDIFRLRAC